MPSIRIDVASLGLRPQAVEKVLRPLVVEPSGTRAPGYVQCERVRASARRMYILAAHSGVNPSSDYRSWRLSTYRRDFRCGYFEIWKPADERNREYYLDRAYLTLFRVPLGLPQEDDLIALHCDPIIEDTEPHAPYKQGPHLHMVFADDPLQHAHLALNRSHLGEILESIDTLSNALAIAVNMLKEEILELDWPDVG